MFLAIAMHLFISKETRATALPAAVVSSQTCAEFIFFFSFSYFALTADAT